MPEVTELKQWNGLYCPSCEKHGVRVYPMPRTYGMKAYTARCQNCGYSVSGLGSDGTQRKAVEEWESLCEHAMQVKKQLFGETKMEEQLELEVTTTPGVTEWFDLDRVQPGPEGWYEVRYKMTEEEREARKPGMQRRYWHSHDDMMGFAGWMSWPVDVGQDYSEDCMRQISIKRATYGYGAMEWRGLAGPHPDMSRKKIRIAG